MVKILNFDSDHATNVKLFMKKFKPSPSLVKYILDQCFDKNIAKKTASIVDSTEPPSILTEVFVLTDEKTESEDDRVTA